MNEPGIQGPEGAVPETGFTEPEELWEDPERFLAVPQSRVKRVVTLRTSGTSGKAKRIYFSEKDLEDTVEGFVSGMSAMVLAGQKAGILFPGTGENGLPELIRKALERLGLEAEIFRPEQGTQTGALKGERDSEPEAEGPLRKLPMQQFSTQAIAFCRGKEFLTGMPADLYRLAKQAPELRPKTVLLSGDAVPDRLRKAIAAAWGCEIYTHYGMTETGFCLAVECPAHCGLHLWTGGVKVETADPVSGRLLPAGEEGELLITALRREAMPLVRYRTGDLGVLVPEGELCHCGSLTPRIRKITGRKEQQAVSPNITELAEVLYGIPQLSAFRVKEVREAAAVPEEERLQESEKLQGFPGLQKMQAPGEGAHRIRKLRLVLELNSPADPGEIKKDLENRFRGTEFELSTDGEQIPWHEKVRIF